MYIWLFVLSAASAGMVTIVSKQTYVKKGVTIPVLPCIINTEFYKAKGAFV